MVLMRFALAVCAAGVIACSNVLGIQELPQGPDSSALATDAAADAFDAVAEARTDSHADAAESDGCSSLDTTSNCGACGRACAPPQSTSVQNASCNGKTCSYTCASGYSDCNARTAPDLDGCECATPVCCNSKCAVQHDDGLGTGNTIFYDCEPTGTYDQTLAMDACKQFTGDVSQCTTGSCTAPDGGPSNDLAVCSSSSPTDCVCWTYSGMDMGLVYDPGSTNCQCPIPGNPQFH
jgi:hypothetical protein